MNTLVGQQLRQAREEQDLSIEQVSAATHIRKQYLEALEQGDYGSLPSAIQVKGFLGSYADFLGLDGESLLASLNPPDPPSSNDTPTPAVIEPQPDPAEQGRQSAQKIFNEIGDSIVSRREMLGLSRSDIEEHLHIPFHYIDLIESGHIDRFPSPVQARGMLGNYIEFLEMDQNAVFSRYAEALQTRLTGIQIVERQESESSDSGSAARSRKTINPLVQKLPQAVRNFLSPDALIFGVLGVTVIIFVIWGAGRIITTAENQNPIPTAPSLVDVLLPTATSPPTANPAALVTPSATAISGGNTDPGGAEPTQEISVPSLGQGNIQLFIIIRQRAFLRVTVDGKVEFDGRAAPGSNLPYSAAESIEVLTGNAAALQIFLNEEDLGPLGIFGEVINVIYTVQGAFIPTPTITPTLRPDQLTPTPTPTPSPTNTQPPTSTQAPGS